MKKPRLKASLTRQRRGIVHVLPIAVRSGGVVVVVRQRGKSFLSDAQKRCIEDYELYNMTIMCKILSSVQHAVTMTTVRRKGLPWTFQSSLSILRPLEDRLVVLISNEA